jgi:hypothetical protein
MAEVMEHRIAVGLNRTCIGGFFSYGKKQRKDEINLRVEIVEPRIPEVFVTFDPKYHASLDRGLQVKFSVRK